MNEKLIEKGIKYVLKGIGEDIDREGLKETPKRVAKFYINFFKKNIKYKKTIFHCQYDEMVIVKNITFYSLCEHHLIPFFGKIAVGYIPDGKVLGLSKLIRIVKKHTSKLQIQERLTQDIANEIEKVIKPQGVGVLVKAEHLCMSMRGVETPGHLTITSCMKGNFLINQKTREEFLKLSNE